MAAANILTSVIRRTSGKGSIATVTVSRPSKLNSLNSHLLTLLAQKMDNISQENPGLLAVILTGYGQTSFIGGADIREMAALESPAAAREFITRVHTVCKSVRDCPVPVIGRINGYALGAGLEIAASCDFRVASEKAIFGMPEVNVGIPSVVEAALLPGMIGWGRTRRLLLLGDNISAVEALQWGLIEKVVEPECLDRALEEWVQLLERSGPQAVRRQKKLIRQWEQLSLEKGIAAGIPAFEEAFEKEGEGPRMLSEFFRKRQKGD
ncbi:ClpP/crotonase-like domain-containing protein [Aspergillus pseudoustus]|uniref:ClpP/crotonase-like domain-containing protein n=1 Tax=Aspergillus pseudoustus TaxID=1810923 RepID=A0ABR4KEK8_9EURO